MEPASAFPAELEKLTFELDGSNLFLLTFILHADGQQGQALVRYPLGTEPKKPRLCEPGAYKNSVDLVWYL